MNKTYRNALYILKSFSFISLVAIILTLVAVMLHELKIIDLTKSAINIKVPFYNGYDFPVRMTITNVADTSVTITKSNDNKHQFAFKVVEGANELVNKSTNFDSLENDTNALKKMVTNRIIAYLPQKKLKTVELDTVSINSKESDIKFYLKEESFDTTIKAKGKTKWQNFLLLFPNLILSIFWIIINYQIFKIFDNLLKEISFKKIIAFRLQLVGWLFIGLNIFLLFYRFVFKGMFDALVFETTYMPQKVYEGIKIQLFASDFSSFNSFMFGLLLLVFSYLFKLGSNLEEEQNLTI